MKKMIAAALTVLLLHGLYRFSLPSLTEEQAGFTEKIGQEEKEKKDDRTAALQEKGFPQSVAERLDEDTVNQIYEKMETDQTESMAVCRGSYFVEFPSAFTGTVQIEETKTPSSQLEISADALSYISSAGEITGCDVSIVYEWLSKPGNQNEDMMAIGWEPGLLTYSGYMRSSQKVENLNSGKEVYYGFSSEASLAGTGKIGWYINLQSPDITPKMQDHPGGSAYISFIPAKPLEAPFESKADIQLVYSHSGREAVMALPLAGE